jgi:hypothetical protein
MTKDIKDKTFDELSVEDLKNIEIVFAPGAFDTFEGTQEELDEFMTEIQRMFTSGEILEKSQPLDIDSLDDEELERLAPFLLDDLNDIGNKRNLQ